MFESSIFFEAKIPTEKKKIDVKYEYKKTSNIVWLIIQQYKTNFYEYYKFIKQFKIQIDKIN